MSSLSRIRSYLKVIEEGDFDNFDMVSFTKVFQAGIFKYGDHLQYVLHKFCRQSEKAEVEVTVISLCDMCFSMESVLGFNNMDRFLGSLFYITSYFLKRGIYSAALKISNSVDFKKTEIENCAEENPAIRNFLYNLHSIFIASAQEIANETGVKSISEEMDLSYQLADISIKFLKMIKFKQVETGKKIFRNFKNYFSSLKCYEKSNVYSIYRGMESALNNIMPKYSENNFLYFYLIKLDQVGKDEKLNFASLNKYFLRHLELISIFMKDLNTLSYWNTLLTCDSLDSDYMKIFTSTAKKIITGNQSRLHSLIFSIYFNHAVQFWIIVHPDKWLEIFSSKIISQIYTQIFLRVKALIRNDTDLSDIGYQMDVCSVDLCKMNFLWILYLIRLCLKYNVPSSLSLIKKSRTIFSYIQNDLNKSTRLCCTARKQQLWNNLVIYYTNTVESLLRQSDSNSVWTYMKDCCEELIFEILNSSSKLPYEWKRVTILFQRWHYACLKLGEYDEALFISTFFIISFPEEEEDALSMWIQTKKSLSSDPRQLLTFKDIIDREEGRIKCMNPKYDPFGLDVKKLLMMELMAYSTCPAFDGTFSKTAMALIIKIWDMLKSLDLELRDKAAASNNVLISAILSNDSKSMSEYKKECEDIVDEMLGSRDARDCRNLLYAGNLKYTLFLCHMKSVQDVEDKNNSSKSILEFLKKEEEEKVKFGEDVDLNLTCNVMPSTNHFTVSFEEKYLTALNEILSFWQEASERVNAECLEVHEFNAWLHNIKHISQMYYLMGDFHQSFVSWILYYQIAKVCKNHSSVLLALSQVIPECTKVENTKLLKESEQIADELSANGKEKDVLIRYWLAVAFNHLKNRNEMDCFNCLCKIKSAIPQLRNPTMYHTCWARYWCLVSKFLLLRPDRMEEFELKENTELASVLFKAYNHANRAVKDGLVGNLGSSEYMEILMTMMEVNLWAVDFFGVFSQAAFMRFFLDDLYQIFQKLVLPTRTAFVLVFLAEVDLMCEKIDDATIKLNSLKRILGRNHVSSAETAYTQRKKWNKMEVPNEVDEEVESQGRLSPVRFLDIQDPVRERDPSPLRFILDEVDLARQFNHMRKCDCYSCRSLIIKFLCVNVMLLEGRLSLLNGSKRISSVHYEDGYTNLKKLETCQRSLSDRMSKLADDFIGIIDFQGYLIRVNSIKFLLHYALFILSTWKYKKSKEAGDLINEIDRIMASLSYEEKLFQWKVLELKLAFVTIDELKEEELIQNASVRANHSPNRIPMKTPIASKKPNLVVAPAKCKPAKLPKSPNDFMLKPIGRKILIEEGGDKSSKEDFDKVKATRKKVVTSKEVEKRTRGRKRVPVSSGAPDV